MNQPGRDQLKEKARSIGNVVKYFRDSAPSDWEMNLGGAKDQAEKTIAGIPALGFYVLSGLAVLLVVAGIKKIVIKGSTK